MAELTGKEFMASARGAYQERLVRGQDVGPSYGEPESSPVVWYDQAFEMLFEPSGSVECERALLAGATQNGLDVILVASASNEAEVNCAAGATITLKTLQGDGPEGPFEAVGGSVCVTAPDEGILAEPGGLVARFAVGNFRKQWLKVSLEFGGSITGGKVDCALSYVAR